MTTLTRKTDVAPLADTMPTWTASFRAVNGAVPHAIRMRRLLKYALRTCGMRCVDFDCKTEQPAAPAREIE